MAKENNKVVYNDIPNLSQVKIGDQKYNIKDKAGRDALDAEIEARISGDTTLQGNITAEETRAKAEEAKKVDKETGKSLVSDSEITKLAGVSAGANKVTATAKSGKISIDGTEVQIVADNTVTDANYKHITVTSTSVSDGSNTFNKYDDSALAARVTTAEGDIDTLESGLASEIERATGVESGLDTRIQNLEARGRFLSSWNVGTGLPGDYPSIEKGAEYPYKAGDYYIVGSVPASGNKYQPDGTKITRDASGNYSVPKKAETREVGVGDYYLYTATGWIWIQNSEKTVNFSSIAGDAKDNTNLKGYLNAIESDIDALQVDAHTHANKDLLDTYDQTNADIKSAVQQKHSHSNKEELDKIASGDKAKWDAKQDALTETQLAAVNSGINAAGVTKLSGIETGAQVNKIESISLGGSALPITGKDVALDTVTGGALALKDEVAESDLDSALATKINGKADTTYVNTELAKKQNTIDASHKLSADLVADGTNNKVYTATEKTKLGGIEAGAEVNIIEKVKLNGTDLTPDSERRIDLGDIATLADTVTGVQYVDDSHKLQAKKGNGEYADVHQFGDLADTGIAQIQAKAQEITGITASYTPSGNVAVSHTATPITSTGTVTAEGSINVTLSGNTFNAITAIGTLPQYTDGKLEGGKATVIDTSKFSGGTAASWTGYEFTKPTYEHTGFSGGELGDSSKGKFAKKIMKLAPGTGDDSECLIVSYVDYQDAELASNFDDAVTEQGTFTAASYGTDTFTQGDVNWGTFDGGSIASISSGFYTPGSDAEYTAPKYVAGSLPTMAPQTVSVESKTFEGSAVDISVSGSYDKANTSAVFTGTPDSAAVGKITVAAADIEKKTA